MLLQVHDELVFEVAPGEREQLEALVREQMGGAYPLDVPLEVSVGVGRELGRRRPLTRPWNGPPPRKPRRSRAKCRELISKPRHLSLDQRGRGAPTGEGGGAGRAARAGCLPGGHRTGT